MFFGEKNVYGDKQELYFFEKKHFSFFEKKCFFWKFFFQKN